MPRENPQAALNNQIAQVGEEIDRLESYQKTPKLIEERLHELVALRSQLYAQYRHLTNAPKTEKPKK